MNNEIWYTLPNHCYSYYIKNVRDNENTPRDIAESKMNRNIRLAKPIYQGETHSLFTYGCMMIKTKSDEKGDRIVSIWNRRRKDKNWEKHMKKYNKLNKRFGIPQEV